MAFTEVEWTWNLDAWTDIDQEIDIYTFLDPSGLVALENLQVQIGDVTAESYVSGVDNNRPEGEGGQIEVDLGSLELELEASSVGIAIDTEATATYNGPQGVTGNLTVGVQGGGINPGGTDSASVDLGSILVGDPAEALVLDAELELPEVVSSATAVGNASSVRSEVKTDIHEAQVLFGTGEVGDLSGALASLTFLTPAQVSATSQVNDIFNATVDSNATAVGNLKSIEVAAATPDDAILIADVKQFSYADVSALSNVYDVEINNYDNLAAIDRPIVSSVATAIGNNLSVTVTSPLGGDPFGDD
jgi:hypothetical protein